MHEKLTKCPNFNIFARKINKVPEFYMIFARKYFFPIFFFGGGQMPPTPVSYAYVLEK